MSAVSTRPNHASWRLLCSLLLGLLITGCASSDRVEDEPASQILSFERVGHGQHADLADTTEVVIRSAETWGAYGDSLRPIRAFEDVDFAESMVLLVAIPVRSGGYGIEFEAVEQRGDAVTARYRFAVPGDDCMTTMALATPFQAVRVPQTDASVRFERRREAYSCAVRQ